MSSDSASESMVALRLAPRLFRCRRCESEFVIYDDGRPNQDVFFVRRSESGLLAVLRPDRDPVHAFAATISRIPVEFAWWLDFIESMVVEFSDPAPDGSKYGLRVWPCRECGGSTWAVVAGRSVAPLISVELPVVSYHDAFGRLGERGLFDLIEERGREWQRKHQ